MMRANPLHVLGISGSLRRSSYNTALLRNAVDLLPSGMKLEIADLSLLPMFNEDIEKPFPDPVAELRDRIAKADALLIASCEYNSSVSGVLKNAIDWISRPPKQPWNGKPVGIIGASTGNFGTVRSQMHLRQILTKLGALPLGKPELLIPRAEQAFDSEGKLTDVKALGYLKDLLQALDGWTRRFIGT